MEFNKQTSSVRSSASEAIIDQLCSCMLKVYNYMASGVLLTVFVALAFFKMAVVTSNEGQIIGLTNFGNTIYASGLKWVNSGSLAIVFYTVLELQKCLRGQTAFDFATNGRFAFINIFDIHRRKHYRVFFITAGTFGAMSIYDTTKRDLTKLGSFLMMGLFGIIIASLVNIFMKSTMMYL